MQARPPKTQHPPETQANLPSFSNAGVGKLSKDQTVNIAGSAGREVFSVATAPLCCWVWYQADNTEAMSVGVFQQNLLRDTKNWISYDFHLSRNAVILLCFQPSNIFKPTLTHRPYENRKQAEIGGGEGHGPKRGLWGGGRQSGDLLCHQRSTWNYI